MRLFLLLGICVVLPSSHLTPLRHQTKTVGEPKSASEFSNPTLRSCSFKQSALLTVLPAALTLRLNGGMGRKTLMADRYVKKRKDFEERDDRERAAKQAEEEELAEEVRGLPLEERMKYAFAEDEDGADDEDGNVPESDDSGDEDTRVRNGKEEKYAAPAISPQGEDSEPEINNGTVEECVGAHRLRTAWCSGDAWAGLFFDVQARSEAAVTVRALALASHIFRREPHASVNIFARNSSGQEHEGEAAGWRRVFSAMNCSLPTVGKRTEGRCPEPYAQCVLTEPVHIGPDDTAGFAVYTNSLCGLALRWPSLSMTRSSNSPDDLDFLGIKIGNATGNPIVSDSQDARRHVKGGVSLGEVTDADDHIKIRAGYCSPVTGLDHPFLEEDLERDPENVRAFVGEVIYDVGGSGKQRRSSAEAEASSVKPEKKVKKTKKSSKSKKRIDSE